MRREADEDWGNARRPKRTMRAASGGPQPMQVNQKLPQQLVFEAGECILHKQLAPFQRNDLEIVDRGMSVGFGYFHFQGAMPSFQFCKMGFYGHQEVSLVRLRAERRKPAPASRSEHRNLP